MHRAQRKITYLLLAVLLATVLSPSFGWEASVGQNAHDESNVALDHAAGTHDRHGDDQCGGDSLHDHGCAGHMFGHLVAYLDDVAVFTSPDLDSGVPSEPDAAVVPGFSERLDRPPLTPALA